MERVFDGKSIRKKEQLIKRGVKNESFYQLQNKERDYR